MSQLLIEKWQKILDALNGVDVELLSVLLGDIVEDVSSKSGFETYRYNTSVIKELNAIAELSNNSLLGIYRRAPNFVRSVLEALTSNGGLSYRDLVSYSGEYIRVPYYTLSEIIASTSIYSYPKSNPVMMTLNKAKYKPLIQAEETLKKIKGVVTDDMLKVTRDVLMANQSDAVEMSVLEKDFRQAGLWLDSKPNPVIETRVRLTIFIKGAGRGPQGEKPQPAADIKRIIKEVLLKHNLGEVYNLKEISVWRGDRKVPQPAVSVPIIKSGLQRVVKKQPQKSIENQLTPKVKSALTAEVFEALQRQGKQKAAFLVVRKDLQNRLEILSGHNDIHVAKKAISKGGKYEGIGAVVLARVSDGDSILYKKV